MSGNIYVTRPTGSLRDARDLQFFSPPGGAEQFLIDMSGVDWVSPVVVAGLLARCLGAVEQRDVDVTLNLPNIRVCRTYLERIGFFAALIDQGVTVDLASLDLDQTYPVRACLPVTKISTESQMERAANSLQAALRAGDAPTHLSNPAYDVLAELTNNAREHGSTCYALAQTHSGTSSGTPGVYIAVADFGAGFEASLAAYKPKSEAAAVVMAFDEGVTGTGDRTRGLGLGCVRDYVDNYGGTLEIVSRHALVRRHDERFERSHGRDCGGVFVTAYFPFQPPAV